MAQNNVPQLNGEPENSSKTTSVPAAVYRHSAPAAPESGRVGVYERPATRLSTLPAPMLFGLLVLILVLAALSFIAFRAIF